MIDITKIVQALEDSDILLKWVNKTIKNETKEQKGEFLIMLLGTLGASFFRHLLTGKGIVRAGTGKKMRFLMPHHPLTNFKMQKYYKSESKFNGVFSWNNVPKKLRLGHTK